MWVACDAQEHTFRGGLASCPGSRLPSYPGSLLPSYPAGVCLVWQAPACSPGGCLPGGLLAGQEGSLLGYWSAQLNAVQSGADHVWSHAYPCAGHQRPPGKQPPEAGALLAGRLPAARDGPRAIWAALWRDSRTASRCASFCSNHAGPMVASPGKRRPQLAACLPGGQPWCGLRRRMEHVHAFAASSKVGGAGRCRAADVLGPLFSQLLLGITLQIHRGHALLS